MSPMPNKVVPTLHVSSKNLLSYAEKGRREGSSLLRSNIKINIFLPPLSVLEFGNDNMTQSYHGRSQPRTNF